MCILDVRKYAIVIKILDIANLHAKWTKGKVYQGKTASLKKEACYYITAKF